MASIASRSSVLGVKAESSEGVLLAPASATDYMPLQTDFVMNKNLEQIENLQLTGTIGAAATILGAENPSASFTFYLKAHTTEGTKPEWSDIFKAFFGTETTEGTERSTTTGSTTTMLEVTGASGFFARGYGFLIKDSVNGYRVRVCDSVATTQAQLSFAVPVAPGDLVALGKPTYWTPANASHITLSLWWYGGNGGVVNAMAGARCSELAIAAQAGQPITCQASFEGLKFYTNPIEITSSTRYIDFEDDDGTESAALTVGWYSDPMSLAAAATILINATTTTETHLVEYVNSTGKFKFTATGTVLELQWATGANTANTAATKFGFTVADETGVAAATGYTSDSAITLTAPHTPTYDASQPLVAKNQEVMLGDQDDYTCFGASNVTINGTDAIRLIESICAESGRSGSIVSKRDWEIQVTALAEQYDVDKDYRMTVGQSTRFQYTMGEKTGGQWVVGKIVYAYSPTCVVTNVETSDDDGLITRTYTLKPFVNSTGQAELIMGTL